MQGSAGLSVGAGRPTVEFRFDIRYVASIHRVRHHFVNHWNEIVHRANRGEGRRIWCAEQAARGREREGSVNGGKGDGAKVKLCGKPMVGPAYTANCSWGVAVKFQNLLYIVLWIRWAGIHVPPSGL
jgi:hypothetical protein